MKRYLGEIGLIVTAVIWGSGFVASAVSLGYYSPYQILAGRFMIGAILLMLVFHKSLLKLNKNTIWRGAVLGVFLYMAFALQTVGLQYTTPSKNAFLTAINVVIVPFIAFFLYKRKINLFDMTGAVLAIIGVAAMSLQWSAEINIGDLLTLCCAIGFAFHIFYTAKFVGEADAILLTIIQMVTAGFIGATVVLFRGEMAFSTAGEGVFNLLYLAVFSTTIAYLLQTVGQKYVSETKAAIILSTESLWGMAFSIIFIHEVLTIRMAIGACIILAAILISETKLNFLRKPISKEVA
ncbi:DMT family transporter [Chungangia koreensis]|uniref:DMT family transporter n=1 Tax=Chungangia koreensis TaxID=752657 RepID=A0ABV8X5X9_9LACT